MIALRIIQPIPIQLQVLDIDPMQVRTAIAFGAYAPQAIALGKLIIHFAKFCSTTPKVVALACGKRIRID